MKTKISKSKVYKVKSYKVGFVAVLSLLFTFHFQLSTFNCFAQTPNAFKYQAVVRNASGNVLQNQNVSFRINLLQGSSTGAAVYSEEHIATTNQFGLVNLEVGNGTNPIGTFSAIDWNAGPYFIKVEMDATGGSTFTEMGVTQLLSVPYALFAASGNQGPQGIQGPQGDTGSNGQNGISVIWLGTFTSHPVNPITNNAYYNSTDKKSYIYDGAGWQIIAQDGNQGLQGTPGSNGQNGISMVWLGTFTSHPLNPTTNNAYYNSSDKKSYIFDGIGWQIIAQDGMQGLTGTQNRIAKFTGANSLGNSLFYESGNYIGLGTTTPVGRLVIQGDSLSADTIPLLEVNDKSGKTVFVVWPDGVHVYVKADTGGAKGQNRGSFAVSGKSSTKSDANEFFSVNSDSIKASKSLYIPRMTTTERDNLPFVPSEALIIFNITDGCMQIYKENVWSNIWCFHCSPSIITQPFNATLCNGEDTSFTISATGTNLNYRWQKSTDGGVSWTDITDGGSNPSYLNSNSNTLYVNNIPVSHNGYKYHCVVTGSCNPAAITETVIMNVGGPGLTIITQPSNQQTPTNCNTAFDVTPSSYGTYQWQLSTNGGSTWSDIFDGGTAPVYSGVTTSHLLLSNVPLGYNNYQYRCVVSSSCGAGTNSNGAILAVTTIPTNATVATNITHFSFSANWDTVPDATGYEIDVSADEFFSSFVPGYNSLYVGNVTTYSITGLNVGTTYYYRFRAFISTCGSGNSNTITVATTAFTIGESYCGGIIFYIDGTSQHGLIAATSDQSTGAEWGCYGTTITGADSTAIGTGNQNTIDIEAGCTTQGTAAHICANLVLNGYGDWFLPSRDELNLMYINRTAIGGFASSYYWSSSEYDNNYAWLQYFGNGDQLNLNKDYAVNVRAVRAF